MIEGGRTRCGGGRAGGGNTGEKGSGIERGRVTKGALAMSGARPAEKGWGGGRAASRRVAKN